MCSSVRAATAFAADGTPDWIIPTSGAAVDDAVRAAAHAIGEDGARAGDTLVGSSRGAYAACEILSHVEAGPWSSLVLIGASVDPDPARLERAGIRRVLLAAPLFDVAAPAMRVAQKKLCKAGLPARFVEMGHRARYRCGPGVTLLAASMRIGSSTTSPTSECAR